MIYLKRIILSFVMLAIAFTSSAQTDFTYTYENVDFAVSFPVEYTTSDQSNENAKVLQATCVYKEHTFLATYSRYNGQFKNPDDVADLSIKAFGESVGGDPMIGGDWIVDDHTGKSVIFMLPKQKTKIIYRVLIIGQIQYQLVVMGTHPGMSYELSNIFFDSFKLLN